jgi:transposase
MKKLYHVQLSAEQRAQLEQLISSGTHKARVLARARILLLADTGLGDTAIAAALQLGRATVERTRRHFATASFERTVYGNTSPGRPPTITGDVEAKLVMLACSAPPAGRARWTLRLLADQMVELGYIATLSDGGVRKLLKKTGLSLGRSSRGASPRPMPAS